MSWSGYIPGSLVRDGFGPEDFGINMPEQAPDRFVHKQFPWARESMLRIAFDQCDWEALIQYLKDQGIEVRP